MHHFLPLVEWVISVCLGHDDKNWGASLSKEDTGKNASNQYIF